jgi:hypothetical protein
MKFHVEIPIRFPGGEMVITCEGNVTNKAGKEVDYSPEKIERLKKRLAIETIEHTQISEDCPPEVAQAIAEVLAGLKAEYN